MKVLQIYKDYYPPTVGGIEKHINIVSNGLKKLGIHVEVLVSNTRPVTISEAIEDIRVTKSAEFGRFASAPINPTMPYILKRMAADFDLLHFYLPNPTAVLSFLLNRIDKPYIVTYHSDIVRQANLKKLYLPLESIFLNKASAILASSPNYIESSQVLKNYKNKCKVIPIGISIERICARHDEQNYILSDGNEKFVLFVGKFRHYKGLHILIDAMKHVKSKLFIIGDGVLKKNLVEQVKNSNLSDKVFFFGELSDEEVYGYMQKCNLLVLPSTHRSEAYGIVLLEAMACGKPVVSTELNTGTSYINQHGKTGIVVKPNDPTALANAINFLLDNPEVSFKFGESAKEWVRTEFKSDKMVQKTLDTYRECLLSAQKNKFKRKYGVSLGDEKKSNKIKLLRVVSRLNIGGPSIHCSILLDGFNNSRFASKLVTGSVSPHEGDMSYRVNSRNELMMRIPEMQREITLTQDIKAFYKLFKIIHKENPDIVHSHMAKAGALSRAAVWAYNLFLFKKKVKTVHTYHGHVLEGYFNPIKSEIFVFIERILAKFTDAIVAISQTQKWEFTKKYRICDAKKIHVINLGFDLSCFLNQSRTGKLHYEIGVDEHTILIGIVGRLVPIKNHRLFLDAAKLIKEKLSNRSVRFIIVGDGELREDIELYAEKINIRNDVFFYGWAKDIQHIYSDLDIVLLTSDNEGTPVSIIEAMASSVPVVTTDVGGVKDLLGHMENSKSSNDGYSICERGIRCPKGNPEAIANGVVHLVGNEKNGMVGKARDFVLQNYTDKKLIESIERLYTSLL